MTFNLLFIYLGIGITFNIETEVHLIGSYMTCVPSTVTSFEWVNGEVIDFSITCGVEPITFDWIMAFLPFYRGMDSVNSGS